MVYILEIISLADFRHLGLLCGGAAAAIDAFRGTLPSNICETTSTSASIRFVKLSARMREPSMVPFHWDPRLLQPPKKQPWRPLHISEYANRIIIHTYLLTLLLHYYTYYGTIWYMYYNTMVSFIDLMTIIHIFYATKAKLFLRSRFFRHYFYILR